MLQISTRHFLQSDEWAQFQKSLGGKVIQRQGDGWQYLALLERGYGTIGRHFLRLYCPYGPFAVDSKALQVALADLEQQAVQHQTDYIRIEPIIPSPDWAFGGEQFGYTKQAHAFQPERTLFIDLEPDFTTVLGDMSETNRRMRKKAAKLGMEFSISYELKDLEAFMMMMEATASRTQRIFQKGQYYELLLQTLGASKHVGVAYASINGEILTGVLFADDHEAKIRYYLYAGSFDTARKYSANGPLVCYLLEEAKQRGIKMFDFYGVAPLDAPEDHAWAGFSRFKRSFGGREHVFVGTWEKPLNKWRYMCVHLLRKFA